MKTVVLAGVMLALALVLGIAWWSHESAKNSALAEHERLLQDAEASAASRLQKPENAPSPLEDVTAVEPARTEVSPPTVAIGGLPLVGRVTSDGACIDEELEVFATSVDPREGPIGDVLGGDPKEIQAEAASLLARAKVEKDGTFALRLPVETKTAWVCARGRYLYSREPLSVDPRAQATVLIATVCGGCIEGRVEAPLGAGPITEAIPVELGSVIEQIAADGGRERVRRRARVSEASFIFRALPTSQEFELAFTPDTHPALVQSVGELAPGRTRRIDVRFGRGGTVRGRVVGPDGAGIADAEVRALRPGRWFGFDDKAVRERKTASDGGFELPAVSVGALRLSAKKEGLIAGDPLKLQITDGAVVEGLVVELGQGNSIEGSITWPDGRPGKGVRIEVEFDKTQQYGMTAFNAARGATGSAIADDDGRFAVRGLGPGPFSLKAQAEAPGASPDREKEKFRARKDDVKPNTKALALVLRPPSGVRGRVVDTLGAPVKEFTIVAQGIGKGLLKEFGQEHIENTVKSEAGAFLVELPGEGDWQLTAQAAEHATSDPKALTLPLAADADEIVITLEKAARVSGVVADPRGVAVPGAEVEVATGEPAWMRQVSSTKSPSAIADDQGRFTITGLKGGQVKLVATAKNHARSLDTPVDVPPGEERSGVVITLRVGGRLTGEVFDAGRPAPAMLVQATLLSTANQATGFTDASGRFTIDHLEPGSYQVVAISTNRRGADEDGSQMDPAKIMSQIKMASAEIVDGEEAHVVLGAPPKDPVRVHGRVMHGGEPFSGAMIVFTGESKDLLAGMKTASLGADGTYSVDLDGPGRFSVTVQSFSGKPGEQSSVEFKRVVPAVKDHQLDLVMPNARISGRVLGPDGAPASGVTITLQKEGGVETGSLFGGQFVMKSTDAEGRFDLDAIKPGVYTVAAGGSPLGGMLGEERTFGRVTKKHVAVKDGEWIKGVDFRLEKPGVVEVTVVGPDDRPVAASSVFARDAEGQLVDVLSMVATGPDGKANYSGLAPGRYTFSAREGDRASADSPSVEVDVGTTRQVKLTLAGGTMLVVRVVDDKGEAVDAQLVVLDAAGRDLASMMGLAEMQKRFMGGGQNRDEQRIGPLSAGKYRVRAVREDGKSVEKPVSLSGQAERKLTLQF
jgi:protocatechuate 3,4-dioxygenase beta subunit